MHHAGDELAHRVAPAEGDAAELEMRALGEPHLDLDPPQTSRSDHRKQLAPRACADRNAQAAQLGALAILDRQALAITLARRHVDRTPGVEIGAHQRLDRRVAPGLVLAGGEGGQCVHAATAS